VSASTSSKSSKLAESGVQAWHVVVLVVAAVLGLWQLSRIAVNAKASGDVKVVKSPEIDGNVGTAVNPSLTPTQQRASESYRNKVLKDKDADSDE
jgi:hypothetical protein